MRWVILMMILLLPLASAHVPYLADEQNIVDDPIQSRAYYGEITDDKHVYVIERSDDFLLYVQILAPYKENVTPQIDFEIYRQDTAIACPPPPDECIRERLIEPKKEDIKWEKYYEEYGRDTYWKSDHVFEEEVLGNGWVYRVEVSGVGEYEMEMGKDEKYSLAIGKEERFSVGDWIRSFLLVIRNKLVFFE